MSPRRSGFFAWRRGLDLPPVADPQPFGLRDYANLPGCVGIPVSRNLATLHEMQTVYGLSDAYELMEIIAVDGHNQRLWSKLHERR